MEETLLLDHAGREREGGGEEKGGDEGRGGGGLGEVDGVMGPGEREREGPRKKEKWPH